MSSLTTPRTQTSRSRQSVSSLTPRIELKAKARGDTTDRSGSETTQLSASVITEDAEVAQEQEEEKELDPQSVHLPFFKQDQYTDVVLQVGGKKLFTARALLAYNSPVLARILSSGSTKNKDLDLPEKEYEDVVELLAYIDPRVDYIITEQSAIALLPLADEYEISGLKQLCEQTIMKAFRELRKGKKHGQLPVEISLEYLHLADKYEFPGLRHLVTDEFVYNEDQYCTKALLESTLISEHVKLMVLDKKVEKVHVELEKERRERTSIETKLGDYGNRRFRKPLMD